MRTIELQICTIKEKLPTDGACCWVKPVDTYPQQLIYNDKYKCWDDAEGDDIYCKINDDDVWMELPNNL